MHATTRTTLVAMLGALVLLPGAVRAATTHVYPGCGIHLQACIDASAVGDTVQLDRPIAYHQDLVISHALTLEKTGSAGLAEGYTITVHHTASVESSVTIRNFSLTAGQIVVRHDGTGLLRVRLEGLT